jgi:hypothetical protein
MQQWSLYTFAPDVRFPRYTGFPLTRKPAIYPDIVSRALVISPRFPQLP